MRTHLRWTAWLSIAAFATVALSCAALATGSEGVVNRSEQEAVLTIPWVPPGSPPNNLEWVICDEEVPAEVNIERIPNDQESTVELTQGHRLIVPAGTFGPGVPIHTVVFAQPKTRYVAVSGHAERPTGPPGPVKLALDWTARTGCRGVESGNPVSSTPTTIRINPHGGAHQPFTGVGDLRTMTTVTVTLDSLSTFALAD